MKSRSLIHQIVVALGAAAVLVGALTLTRPVFLSKTPVVGEFLSRAEDSVVGLRAPWIAASTDIALGTPQFLADREAFIADLVQTGKVGNDRARAIADVAVREAYTRRIPPALVLGVMLTENRGLQSTARSNVGAVGLMQVRERVWHGLSKLFGTNLKSDSTNLKYGIYILGYLASKADTITDVDRSWRAALLRYNGCVHGTNTATCKSYPDIVRRNVERSAKVSCAGLDFAACVVHPLWLAKREGSSGG